MRCRSFRYRGRLRICRRGTVGVRDCSPCSRPICLLSLRNIDPWYPSIGSLSLVPRRIGRLRAICTGFNLPLNGNHPWMFRYLLGRNTQIRVLLEALIEKVFDHLKPNSSSISREHSVATHCRSSFWYWRHIILNNSE